MKTIGTISILAAVLAALGITATGISALTAPETDTNTSTSISSTVSATTVTEAASAATEAVTAASYTASSYSSALLDTSDLFSKRDLSQTADLTDAQYITVADNKTVEITEAGVYVISGTAKNCTIKVNADGENDKVQLVLNGVSITNDSTPAIYVVSADKCFITTAENTTNTLSVTGQFTADGSTNTDAVIFSKDDIVLNGLGTLNITSTYGNGISGKDDIKVTGGAYNITCAEDAVEANDSILVCGGSFTIKSNKDGLHAENDDDDSEGYIYIADGTFDITAKSDGIQGNAFVIIDGGEFSISASEGIEGTYVQINDGNITISASDDGINAARKSTSYSVVIEINGGDLNVTMGQGDTDAIDANGNIIVNGGSINITAPTSSFDYDGTATYNGGTIIINGQTVNSIPQSMMGGGMGGFGGMNGGFGGGMQQDGRGGLGGGRW